MGEMIDIPSPEEQKDIIMMKLTKSLVNGETWYLISKKWMRSFNQFIGIERTSGSRVSHPGPIDNSCLLDDKGELRRALVDKMDYEVVPEIIWRYLVHWYGVINGQKAIDRKVIIMNSDYLIIEVYPVEFTCCDNYELKKPIKLAVSKADTLAIVNDLLKKVFHINQNTRTRLLAVVGNDSPINVNLDDTVGNSGLGTGSTLIIEAEESAMPRLKFVGREIRGTARTSNMGTNAAMNRTYAGAHSSVRRQPGVCGLSNLGNTCFMNSVLQCLSNCPPITEYFLSEKHLLELNETNPLGMKGEIARVYGELIETMWKENCSAANPLSFKIQVGKFNPSFSGCQQHDSQELLTFLLDGLHEDLNRIKKKPYIEVKDNLGRADSVLAKEAWEMYRKRNDSIIVDTFHGLLKSRVVCPECERVSVTFDPFCHLSLPLPLKKDRNIIVRYIPFHGDQRESNFKVSVPRKGIIRDLCMELSRKVSCNADQLIVAEIAHCHFHKFYCNEDSLDNIEEKDIIFVYQLPLLPISIDDEEDLIVPVCFWEQVKPVDRFVQNHLFGVPFLAAIPRRPLSALELQNILKEKMRRHFVFQETEVRNNVDPITPYKIGKQNCFPLFTMDTTRTSLNPQPLEFIDDVTNLRDIMEENYNNRHFGRMVLIVQMTAEERRDNYREKPAEYGSDIVLSHPSSGRDKNTRIDIKDCISLFTTCEKLSADDAWYCPSCRTHQRATKKFDLWRLPKILIIHLKRFSYTRCRRDKIDSLVEFPITDLTISNYVINTEGPDMKYDLIGVCNHYGHLGGGHYTAFCKNKDTQQWYCFDDTNVSPIQSEDSIMTSAAYVLFYMAKDNITDESMDTN